jgi:hypothetical protein
LRKVGAVLAALVLLAGCEGREFEGLTRLDAYASEAADALRVARIECDFTLLVAGERMACRAFNEVGTELRKAGQSVAIWYTTDSTRATVDFDGFVYARTPGPVSIGARGEGGSTATLAVTIELP